MARDDEWQRIRARFISDLGHFFEAYGGSEIMGWIMGLLTFASEALPLPEIAEALQISKAAASIHIRALRQMGLVEKVSFPGDRRDFYLLHRDFEHGLLDGTMKRVQDGAFIFQKTLTALEGLAPDERTAMAGGRLDSLYRLYEQAGRMIEDLCRQWAGKRQSRQERHGN